MFSEPVVIYNPITSMCTGKIKVKLLCTSTDSKYTKNALMWTKVDFS